MSVYEQYRASRTSWGIGAMGSVIVEVELDDNAKTTGVGISIGGEAACFMIENHLSRFVEGQNPSNVELVRDMIFIWFMNFVIIHITHNYSLALVSLLTRALGHFC